ncbi:hypothetical protein LX83_004944 [Goodfellowiella coeruleoviolacea]|uniref:DUF2269 domain-containing protein n=1 Tax=Goodfellowiella coeruleoviolacea TaxID=334858 RepID=A0AAE3GH51_9PSEU|nr:hypothetical protein [Goodfellowiella coeruleoviolacea]
MLLAHVVVSVGWIGVELCLLTLALTGLAGTDPALVESAYRAAGLLAGAFYLPVSVLALVTGVVLGLGTKWGLVRFSWVAIKLVLNTALVVGGNLLVVPMFGTAARLAAQGRVVGFANQPSLVSAMCVGLTLLTAATALSVLKPWGRTWFSRTRHSSHSQ